MHVLNVDFVMYLLNYEWMASFVMYSFELKPLTLLMSNYLLTLCQNGPICQNYKAK